MESVTLTIFRRTLLSGACAVLLAGCGGDEAETAPRVAAAPADSAGPAVSTPANPRAAPADPAAPGAPAAPSAASARARDSAMAADILDAPVTGPVNVEVLQEYQLSMDDVRKLARAAQNLGALVERRPELRDSLFVGVFDPNAIYDRLSSIPAAREAIADAGMTPRQYVTATAALMQAGLVRGMRDKGRSPPPQVRINEANVRFLGEHREEIQQLMQAADAQIRPRS